MEQAFLLESVFRPSWCHAKEPITRLVTVESCSGPFISLCSVYTHQSDTFPGCSVCTDFERLFLEQGQYFLDRVHVFVSGSVGRQPIPPGKEVHWGPGN